MGDPEFKIRVLIKRANLTVFSRNYAVYGSLSVKVSATLLPMVPTIENYSIDESFLNLGEFREREVEPLARELRERVHRWVGIPTCVGIAPTKTLAKAANFIAKSVRSIAVSAICVPLWCGLNCCLRCQRRRSGGSARRQPRSSPRSESRRPPIWLHLTRTMRGH